MSNFKKDLILCFLLENYCKNNDYDFTTLYNKLKDDKLINISYTPSLLKNIPQLEITNTINDIDDVKTNNRVNNYNIIKNIGNGSFGCVFECINNIDTQTYALKLVKLNEKNYTKIFREVQLMATFEHPNIVRYYSSWIDSSNEFTSYINGSNSDSDVSSIRSNSISSTIIPYNYYLFIQMELCKESLSTYLDKSIFDLNKRIHFFKQINSGINYLHSKNVIHRDLKPSNILIGFDEKIKISDFGMSINNEYYRDSYISSDLIGTYLYTAPESINDNIYSFSSDIYSLGIILFELLNNFKTVMEKTIEINNLKENKCFNVEFIDKYKDNYKIILELIHDNSSKRPLNI